MSRTLLVLLVSVLVMAGVWLWVTLATSASERALVGVVGGTTAALLCAATTIAAYRTFQLGSYRRRTESLEADLAQLADEMLPSAVRRLRDGASADTVISELPRPNHQTHDRILRTLTKEISVGERQKAAAMAACANAAGRVQALATSMLADLREMEDRHSEEVLGDLLKLDHSTAQAGRLADSIAVLTGARSGRRWTKPIVMESILRGAMSRIRAYQRVRLHSTSTAAIVGYAAEDVMHALAELMDNATRFSAPSEEVHVYVEELHTGIVVTIEDGGLGMKPQALERAERAVSATEPLDLTKLSGTRLGLAVVGCLARKHQLHVFFRPSSRGGTGVVLRIPNQLVTQPRQEPLSHASRSVSVTSPSSPSMPTEPAASSPQPNSRSNTVTAVLDDDEPQQQQPRQQQQRTLPKRRRGQTLAAAPQPPVPARAQPSRPRTDAGARFGAFRQATRSNKPDGEPAPGQERDPR
ncbi:signal transduction histidine kinase [Saccharomonospora amisosensis]|uniref:histidine kinase n=1 Tax=Saccharomonospora amisosensis TaxID=1128677 RepID=A0A7X5UUE2_9PSEU|nr:ATP-binding protein [Saccharomonospora amisosensis]NIJ13903.1 signal transduction histidine kinase [Saccharomonospora amisosensis]